LSGPVLFAGAFAGPLARAAAAAGLAAAEKPRREPWFDAARRLKPRLVVVDRHESRRAEFLACAEAFKLNVRVRPPLAPAADRPPDWPGGEFRESLAYDIVYFEPPRRDAFAALDKLAAAGLRVACFDPGFVGRPEFAGTLDAAGRSAARRSAAFVFDPSGCPWARAECVVDGGRWLADYFAWGALPWGAISVGSAPQGMLNFASTWRRLPRWPVTRLVENGSFAARLPDALGPRPW
jgi:hypothetical protein